MKHFISLVFFTTVLSACGGASNNSTSNTTSNRIHSTPLYETGTSNAALQNEHAVILSEQDGRDHLLLINTLTGDSQELSQATHDRYRIPQALISADRQHILYIANQDFAERNDLFIASTTLPHARRLTNITEGESVLTVEATEVDDEVLIVTETLSTGLQNFYLFNLRNLQNHSYVRDVTTHNHFLSADNSQLYIMQEVTTNSNKYPDLHLTEVSRNSGAARFLFSVYQSELDWDSTLYRWISDDQALFHNSVYGVMTLLNVANNTARLIDDQSPFILSATAEHLIYFRSPLLFGVNDNSDSGFIETDYQQSEVLASPSLSSNSYTIPPLYKDGNIYYLDNNEISKNTHQYVFNTNNRTTKKLADITENLFFYHAENTMGKYITYGRNGTTLYSFDLIAELSNAIEVPYPLNIFPNSFAADGQAYLAAASDGSDSHVLNINLINQQIAQHTLPSGSHVKAICSTGRSSCVDNPVNTDTPKP